MKNKNNIIYIIIVIIIILLSFLLINNINNKEGNLTKITYNELLEKTKNKDNFILVVSQSTCTHCASYKPKLSKITKEYNLEIFYLDYDLESKENQKKFLDDFDLDGSTPITIFIKKGKQTKLFDRLEGDISETKAVEKFKKMGFIK